MMIEYIGKTTVYIFIFNNGSSSSSSSTSMLFDHPFIQWQFVFNSIQFKQTNKKNLYFFHIFQCSPVNVIFCFFSQFFVSLKYYIYNLMILMEIELQNFQNALHTLRLISCRFSFILFVHEIICNTNRLSLCECFCVCVCVFCRFFSCFDG